MAAGGPDSPTSPGPHVHLGKPHFFFFKATSTAYGSSQARDQIRAAAMTRATAAALPDPLTLCTHFAYRPSLATIKLTLFLTVSLGICFVLFCFLDSIISFLRNLLLHSSLGESICHLLMIRHGKNAGFQKATLPSFTPFPKFLV